MQDLCHGPVMGEDLGSPPAHGLARAADLGHHVLGAIVSSRSKVLPSTHHVSRPVGHPFHMEEIGDPNGVPEVEESPFR